MPAPARACILVAVTVSACATGRFPSGVSQRSLLIPDDEHQLQLGVTYGGTIDRNGLHKKLRPYLATYRFGISDSVNYQLPLVISYGFFVDEDVELVVRAGVYGFGIVNGRIKSFSGDPRRFPEYTENLLLLAPGADLALRFILDDSSAIVANVFLAQAFTVEDLLGRSGSASAGYVVDLTSWVSLAFGAGLTLGTPDDGVAYRYLHLGSFTDGGQLLPAASFHVFDQLDLTVSCGMNYAVVERSVSVYAGSGIDWHFD
jgi:hypothetical protein